MAASNRRNKCANTVHHLMSRIAHKVYFLGEEERNDFVAIMKRAAEFCGIRLYGWCVMTNHFHILVYLPAPMDLDEAEVLRRYGVLMGNKARQAMEKQIADWRLQGQSGTNQIDAWMKSQTRRMYDIGEYMRIVKQSTTVDYNRRHGHVGTLWESVYNDKPVKNLPGDVSAVLAYIHLNPFRAAMCVDYSEYRWSSFYGFIHGDPAASEGLEFIYGSDMSEGEMLDRHSEMLNSVLTEEQRECAQAIARKRRNGLDVPLDPLTTEAMVAQEVAHFEEVHKSLMEMHIQSEAITSRNERNQFLNNQILMNLDLQPDMSVEALAETLGVSARNIYRRLQQLKRNGKLSAT